MDQGIKFSFIIAAYQRNGQLRELLHSLIGQTDQNFEVWVVDDGSPKPLKDLVESQQYHLDVHYIWQENSGPGIARNLGMENAKGDYFIFVDSDVILPATYVECLRAKLLESYTDFFGGPDGAHHRFNAMQKAISFAMTSYLTTGGIRGGSAKNFQPRSFNMGISRACFEATGGFSNLRIGEDPDLSMTLWEKGFKSQLIPEAYVWHKRRDTLFSFAKQVFQFGKARPELFKRHPKYKKLTFWLPSVFLVGLILAVLMALMPFDWMKIPILIYLLYFLLIFIHSTFLNKNLWVGVLSIITSLIQLGGYGLGFLIALLGFEKSEV